MLQIKNDAIYYNIDTEGGQSGSPAYLKYGDKIILVGIHKGYSHHENLNYCTAISKQIVETICGWVIDIKGSLEELQYKQIGTSKSTNTIKSQ